VLPKGQMSLVFWVAAVGDSPTTLKSLHYIKQPKRAFDLGVFISMYRMHVESILRLPLLLSIKIIQLVLHKFNQVILNQISQSIFRLKFFIRMNCKRMEKL
jgi:hypothetical protein